jgi:hypothetical protein
MKYSVQKYALQHPNIRKVLDYHSGDDEGYILLVCDVVYFDLNLPDYTRHTPPQRYPKYVFFLYSGRRSFTTVKQRTKLQFYI